MPEDVQAFPPTAGVGLWSNPSLANKEANLAMSGGAVLFLSVVAASPTYEDIPVKPIAWIIFQAGMQYYRLSWLPRDSAWRSTAWFLIYCTSWCFLPQTMADSIHRHRTMAMFAILWRCFMSKFCMRMQNCIVAGIWLLGLEVYATRQLFQMDGLEMPLRVVGVLAMWNVVWWYFSYEQFAEWTKLQDVQAELAADKSTMETLISMLCGTCLHLASDGDTVVRSAPLFENMVEEETMGSKLTSYIFGGTPEHDRLAGAISRAIRGPVTLPVTLLSKSKVRHDVDLFVVHRPGVEGLSKGFGFLVGVRTERSGADQESRQMSSEPMSQLRQVRSEPMEKQGSSQELPPQLHVMTLESAPSVAAEWSTIPDEAPAQRKPAGTPTDPDIDQSGLSVQQAADAPVSSGDEPWIGNRHLSQYDLAEKVYVKNTFVCARVDRKKSGDSQDHIPKRPKAGSAPPSLFGGEHVGFAGEAGSVALPASCLHPASPEMARHAGSDTGRGGSDIGQGSARSGSTGENTDWSLMQPGLHHALTNDAAHSYQAGSLHMAKSTVEHGSDIVRSVRSGSSTSHAVEPALGVALQVGLQSEDDLDSEATCSTTSASGKLATIIKVGVDQANPGFKLSELRKFQSEQLLSIGSLHRITAPNKRCAPCSFHFTHVRYPSERPPCKASYLCEYCHDVSHNSRWRSALRKRRAPLQSSGIPLAPPNDDEYQ